MNNQIVQTPEADSQERMIDFISWIVHVPSSKIHPYTRFRDDLNLDAVDLLLLIAELENQFQVYLSPEQVEAIDTVQDINFFFRRQAA